MTRFKLSKEIFNQVCDNQFDGTPRIISKEERDKRREKHEKLLTNYFYSLISVMNRETGKVTKPTNGLPAS